MANRRFFFFMIEIWPHEFYFVAGLLIMEDGRIRSVLARTIQEATRVAAGLGAPPSK